MNADFRVLCHDRRLPVRRAQVALHPDGLHSQSAGRALVVQGVFDEHAALGAGLEAADQMAKHPCIRLGAGMSEHRHVLDADHAVEAAGQPQCVQHAPGIRPRCIGQDVASARQAPERRPVVRAGLESRFQAGQAVSDVQEIGRLHAVVADQAEQRGAVAVPVVLAQGRCVDGRKPEVTDDVVRHRLIGGTEGRGAGVVKGVVQIEQPDWPV